MLVDGVPAIPVHPLERPFVVFPPFPDPPAGAQIPVWSHFKPAGIRVAPDEDGIERDGRGIPTVRLGSHHKLTDAEKTKYSSRKKQRKGASGVVVPWYELWQEDETTRRAIINPAINKADRLHMALDDFQAGRRWPSPEAKGNPSLIWQVWRDYLGLSSKVGSEHKSKSKQELAADDEDDDSDMDPSEDLANVTVVDTQRPDTSRAPQEESGKAAVARRESRRESESEKEAFLNDPETSVQIFFSSYWRFKGHVHDEAKCEAGPILVAFFIRYLIRSRVFPGDEAVFKRAAAMCDRAGVELAATLAVTRCLPEKVGNAFERLYGQMDQRFNMSFNPSGDRDGDSEPESGTDADASEEPDAKKRKVESTPEPQVSQAEPMAQKTSPDTASHVAPNIWGISEDDADPNVKKTAQLVDSSGSGNGWGSSTADDAHDTPSLGWGQSSWGASTTLATLPAALSSTHTTGLVESSVRKIAQVILPTPAQQAEQTLTPAAAVEAALTRDFATVVFAPWVRVGNAVPSDIHTPQILPNSRGRHVGGEPKAQAPHEDDARTAFDPQRDAIRVLMDPDTAATLAPHVGIGVRGLFVQLARRAAPAADAKPSGKAQHAKAARADQDVEPTPYWYVESAMLSLTSFHADKTVSGGDGEA
ncbi:hypothetical protein PsYK624_136310 [Phanerochaete sordida]|uniref:Uncharacterized protein n=1 Tax=Phanerochaete sordida TaxID=48140 RepID=A0A9P3GQ37_9APHY|nr:hypothetical protein PsYK624_136310 [Phanerochaete sordida]